MGSKRYFVEITEICENCDGTGWVRNAEWAEVDAHTEKAFAHLSPREREDATVRYCTEYFRTDDPRYWPLPEMVCEECDGQGEFRGREDMTSLFERLLRDMAK